MPDFKQIRKNLIRKMHVWRDHILVKFDTEKRAKTFPACVLVYGRFGNRSLSLTLLGDCLYIHNWSDYEEKNVGFEFDICWNLKMTLYLQNKSTIYTSVYQASWHSKGFNWVMHL